MHTRAGIASLLVVLAARGAAQTPTSPRESAPRAAVLDTGEVGRIVGVVTDSAMRPLPGARISVIGSNVSVTTDAKGRFMFTQVPPGLIVLAVRRLGYKFRYFDIDVTPGDPVDGSVVLMRIAQQLDTIRVSARGYYDKPARLEYTSKYDDFYRRRRTSVGGTFLTRDQIDRMNVASASAVVQRLPYARIVRERGDVVITAGARCGGAVPVFLDGRPTAMGAEIVDMMNADELEAVELHRGIATMPPEARDAKCAIFFWTR